MVNRHNLGINNSVKDENIIFIYYRVLSVSEILGNSLLCHKPPLIAVSDSEID